jgi:hypothetical protein
MFRAVFYTALFLLALSGTAAAQVKPNTVKSFKVTILSTMLTDFAGIIKNDSVGISEE